MSSPDGGQSSARSLFKNIVQDSSLYSIAMIGQRFISTLLLPITTRFLTPADYGILDLLEQVGAILSTLLGSSYAWALGFFYFETDSPEARRHVVGTTTVGTLLLGLLAGLACVPFAAQIGKLVFTKQSVAPYLYVVFLTMPPNFLLEALFGLLRVENRAAKYLVASILRTGITACGVILFVAALRLRIWGVLAASTASIFITTGYLYVDCIRRSPPTFNRALFRRMVRFSIPLTLSNVAMFIIHFGDRFILPHYRPFSEIGLYALAYKLGMLVSAIYASFGNYWNAQVYHIVKRDDAELVFARICTYMVLLVIYCSLGIIVFSKPALRVITSPAYYGAAVLVPVIVVAYALRSFAEFFRCLFVAAGRPEYEAASNWISATVCLAAYFLLIPRWGTMGAAVATAVTFLVSAAVSIAWTYRLNPYSVEKRRLMKIAIALAAVTVPYALVTVRAWAWQMGWAILLSAGFPGLLWMMRFSTPGEREILRNGVGKVKARLGR